jgi:hypothetical protein
MRKIAVALVVLIGCFVWSWRTPQPARSALPTVVFPLKIDGKSWQPQIIGVPGKAIGTGPVKDGKTMQILQGILPDFASDYLDLDPGGKFFLYYDSQTQWRAATNPNGQDTTTLTGQISNDGVVWMFGKYTLPMGDPADIFVTGKVKYQKAAPGTYIPTSIKGTVFFSSTEIDTGMILKFKTLKPAS